jgi:predicted Zn-dependent protease
MTARREWSRRTGAKTPRRRFSVGRFFIAAVAACALLSAAGSVRAQTQGDIESQIGLRVEQSLEAKGEILRDSPDYALLRPVSARIAQVADPLYGRPFRFYVVREAQPNAFAVPGGNVYVTEGMFAFARTREELGGVLCHEVSHDIHHDVVRNARRDEEVVAGASILANLFGHGRNRIVNTLLGATAAETELHFSRSVETNADLTGSDICAAAGIDPYGMIWLLRRFSSANLKHPPEFLSDHPGDAHRIATLRRHFLLHPSRFGGFSADPATGTPLAVSGTEEGR